ncbi:MAG TPA: DUF1549 and DUF1553 domain-containing protein [Gemmataceae bacterium]|nr:DUF1549 and DUF1553 domain-containing protein [Gemmataceae bacterium]
MRLRRSLALFALVTGLAVLAGDSTDALGQPTPQEKKLKKGKKADITPAVPVAPDAKPPAAIIPAAKPGPLAKKDALALAKLIDAQIDRKLAEAKIPASLACSDEEFVRRVYLDLTGVIPPADKAKEFLDSTDPDKRAKLIDELLADPNFGRRLSDIWQAKLMPRGSDNRFVLREPFIKWLEENFNKNTPWDQLVYQLVTATGTVEENPAVTYFLSNRSVDKLTDSVSQNFLGLQLQCAQCHNHPFTEWKQTEYWGMAAFFSKVQPENPRNANKGADNSKIGVTEGAGKSRLKDFFPESAKEVPAKVLGGPTVQISATEPYRPVLAKWMTAPGNPYFARAMTNRTWALLFGSGFINPVNDMLPENVPSNPELLDALTRQFAADGFDLKHLYRAICNTKAYQRTSKPLPQNKNDDQFFSHMTIKIMSPEQLYDSLARVTGGGEGRPARPAAGAGRGGPGNGRDAFVQFYLAGADTANPTEYEAGIPQALRLMNSRITGNPAVIRTFAGPKDTPAQVIEKIYLAALSRRPTKAELDRLTQYVTKAASPTEAYGDILWAVLNSSEFAMVK